ncbi:hypothetical protein K469DRAFT_722640 [Zopfia rhizophila CBS 207.26]|uniref:Kinetochore protein mis14 n=1 Tax=Zopfia rhizophila CBS 207.26 TaxID=1314779 RepID=A0A6A6EWR7_9PEZI|nr:hypothetical protein K469DRAFT_722640 [Zopfia rhizophila CBS 207.26]
MASEHRKIELQSPADLAHVEHNIRHTARQKLDLHLPPVSDSEDELRKKVDALVESFVQTVLASLRQNVSINGLDVVSEAGTEKEAAVAMEEEFEPFNEKLRNELVGLHARRDALISQISRHRRTTPAVAAKAFREQFLREREGFERMREEREKLAGQGLSGGDVEELVRVNGLKREDEVQRNWERSVEGLGRLKGGLPETRARLERCGEVVGYMEGSTA